MVITHNMPDCSAEWTELFVIDWYSGSHQIQIKTHFVSVIIHRRTCIAHCCVNRYLPCHCNAYFTRLTTWYFKEWRHNIYLSTCRRWYIILNLSQLEILPQFNLIILWLSHSLKWQSCKRSALVFNVYSLVLNDNTDIILLNVTKVGIT